MTKHTRVLNSGNRYTMLSQELKDGIVESTFWLNNQHFRRRLFNLNDKYSRSNYELSKMIINDESIQDDNFIFDALHSIPVDKRLVG